VRKMMSKKQKRNYEFSARDLIAAAREGVEMLRAGKLSDLRRTTIELPQSGQRHPSGAALKLLHIARRRPEVLIE
jgi:DNA-binding transcriptional regulator YiaG